MANANWTNRIFTLILIAAVTFSLVKIFEAKNSGVIAGCEEQVKPYAEQVKILSQTLEQVSKAVDALTSKPTTSLMSMASFSFAAFKDTTVRPMSQQQQRQELLLIKGKLDSAKRKVDSLNKIINKQQPQTKT
jgi:hypothetical protein